MGDFVTKEDVERIRAHYNAYTADGSFLRTDNRGAPVSGVRDATTFREVSTHYVGRLLRYIEVQQFLREEEAHASQRPEPPSVTSVALSLMSRAAVRLHQALCRHADRTKSPYIVLGSRNWRCHDCGADWWRNWQDDVGVGPSV